MGSIWIGHASVFLRQGLIYFLVNLRKLDALNWLLDGRGDFLYLPSFLLSVVLIEEKRKLCLHLLDNFTCGDAPYQVHRAATGAQSIDKSAKLSIQLKVSSKGIEKIKGKNTSGANSALD